MFGWGQKDTSTPQERAGWRNRAEEQMAEQRGQKPKPQAKPVDPPRHGGRPSR